MRYFLIPLLLAGPAWAECPPVADTSTERAALLSQLKVAPDPGAAQVLNAQLWEIWLMAPDDKAQDLLDGAVERMRLGDLDRAITQLDELVSYCPDYAEGYNQRAFAYYLKQDFAPALADLDRALAILPEHIGALSGKGLTLIGMGRAAAAQKALREAVDLHPWLSERALLVEPPGEEL
ncbi:tetratricopeptide repeat protein [Cognatishimia sp. MH4019]|uniref:tetratricopeptide repeat protein n=1 Tax=Cognatishimia sp. MH4019 TaxID=2854030 RepID=UPI001CD21252|nr:tetratricopeptide repeat protein [Cognatishimia sp. MH4019]